MRKILVILIALALLATPASAGETRPLKLDQPASARSLPVKEPKGDRSCQAYGAGFVKLAGSDTCVRVGGSTSVGAGTTYGR